MKKRLLYNGALILLLLVNSSVLMAQWTQQNTGFTIANRGIDQISIVDANIVWATAVDGNTGARTSEFTKTSDGGTTWTPGKIVFTGSTGYFLANLHPMSTTTAFAAMPPTGANGGVVAKTTDGGTTWDNTNSPDFSTSWLNWVHFFDNNNGVCMGDPDASGDFVIYTTNNGGSTWTKVAGANIPNANSGENGKAGVYDFVKNSNSIWFTTGKDRVYSSTDKGLTWSVSTPGIKLTRVKFRTPLEGIAYGTGNPVGSGFNAAPSADLRKTTDGGITWERLSPSGFYLKDKTTQSFIGELTNIPGTKTWINTAGSTIYNGSSYSFDDGVSYFNIDTTSTNRYVRANFLDAQTGWAGSVSTVSNGANVGGIYKWCSVATPTFGTITQPATSAGTGTVVLNGLPASGTWNIEQVITVAPKTTTPPTPTTTTLVTAGSGPSATLSGLAPGRYRFRVNYGGCLSMVMDEIVISAMTQATNITFTNVTDNSMTVNWTRGTGDKVVVVARRASAVNANPVNAVDQATGGNYIADPIFGLGSTVGTLNYTVYVGTGTSVNVTGLLAGVNYNFAIYEYTFSTVTSGTPAVTKINTNYLMPALVGNTSTSTVLSNAPCGNFNYLASNAQNVPGTYNEIIAGDQIFTSDFIDKNSDPTPIGFNFKYNCQTFDQFVLNTNGFIKLGSTGTFPFLAPSTLDYFGGTLNGSNAANVNVIYAFNHYLTGVEDLINPANSTAYSVVTNGVSPNRICTIQFKNVKETVGRITANGDAPAQFSNMNFQIKLYETSNLIEVVYGDFTFSTTAITTPSSKVKSVTCGLRGSTLDNSQSLIVNKWDPTSAWSKATFSNTIAAYSGILFANTATNTGATKPDNGRTFRFVPTPANDLAVGQIYSMGEASSKLSNDQKIAVNISNTGLNNIVNAIVTLNVSGVSTVTETKTITLNAGESTVVNFSNFSSTLNGTLGTNTITVTVPSDGNNSNNTNTWIQNVTDYVCNNSTTADPATNAYGGSTGGATYVKYTSSSSHSQVDKVKVFIYNYSANTGKTIQAVVLNDAKVQIGQSTPYVITASDLNTWKEFTLESPAVITNGVFYAGIRFTANAVTYFPVGTQKEVTIRKDAYFSSTYNLSNFSEDISTSSSRYMIGATLSELLPPVVGTLSSSAPSVCSDNTVNLTLTGSTGNIKWQKSLDGGSLWTDIITSASSTLISPAITANTSFRAVVTQGSYTAVLNSNKVDITLKSVIPTVSISGNSTFCSGSSVLLISSVVGVGNTYQWKQGATVLSTTTSSHSAVATGEYTVTVTNANSCVNVSSPVVITVNALPTATITATGNTSFCQGGSVELSSSTGTSYEWKQGAIVLSTTTKTFSPTAAGSYTVKVTDANGCSKVSDATDLKVLDCAGLEELTLETINTYPNPTVGKLNLFTSVELRNANVQLVDIAGKVVYSSKMNFTEDSSTEFDFNELSNGNYILKVNEYQTKVVINK